MVALAWNELNVIVKLVDKASKDLTKMSSKFKAFGDTVSKQTEAARGFTKAVWIWATIVGGLAVKEFATFEKQMSKVKAITGATDEEFKKLNDLAKEMGATTAFTAKEAGDAFEFLGMAGLSVKNSLDALPWTLQLAAAANLQLWEAADIATNIMAQFGIEAKDIWRVNDVLAKSATSANTSVGELAEAMKYMGPVANAMKVPLEETAAAIDILANNGIKGGMAGQSFSASLLRITKLTPKMQASVEALNLKLFDQKGQYVGLTKTVKQLEKGTKNMTDEEKAKHIATLFGIQSTKQWLTLLKEGGGEMERYTELLENAGGTAEKMAKTQLDNLAGSFTLLKSAISGVAIELGGKLAPIVRTAIDWLTNVLSNFKEMWAELSPEMQKIIWIAGAVAGGLTALTLVVGTLGMLLPLISGGLAAIASVFAFVLSPIGLVVAAIVGLGIAYKTNFGGFADFVNWIAEKLKPIFESIANFVIDMVWQITAWLDRVKGPFMEIVNFLLPYISEFLGILGNLFKVSFDNLITMLGGAWDIIKGVFQVAFSVISGTIEIFLAVLTGDWEGAWIALKEMTVGILTGLQEIFSGFFTIIAVIARQGLIIIKSIFNVAWTWIKLIVTAILNWITTFISDIMNGLVDIVDKWLNLLTEGWVKGMESMGNIVDTVWGGIKSAIASSINWVIDKINRFIKQANKVIWHVPGATKIDLLSPIAFEKGGIVPGFQIGGIVPGWKTPANHDQVPAMLDPGELILNRSQQANLASQLTNSGSSGQTVIQLNISWNNFYGDDEGLVDKIGNTIVEKFLQHQAIESF